MRCDYCGWLNSEGQERCVKCNQVLSVQKIEPVSVHSDVKAEESSNNAIDTICTSCGYPIVTDVSVCPACGAEIVKEPKAEMENVDFKATMRDASIVAMVSANSNLSSSSQSKSASVNVKQTVRDIDITELNKVVDTRATMRADGVTTADDNENSVARNKEKDSSVIKQTVPIAEDNIGRSRLIAMDDIEGNDRQIEITEPLMALCRSNVEPDNMLIAENNHAVIENDGDQWYIKNAGNLGNTYLCVNRKMQLEDGDILIIGNKRYLFRK